jgi:hypothetical protein
MMSSLSGLLKETLKKTFLVKFLAYEWQRVNYQVSCEDLNSLLGDDVDVLLIFVLFVGVRFSYTASKEGQ